MRDRDRLTGAGVTSGIDFALSAVALLAGEEVVREIQLQRNMILNHPVNPVHPESLHLSW